MKEPVVENNIPAQQQPQPQPLSMSDINIPTVSQDDMLDPTVKGLVDTVTSMKSIMGQQQAFIQQSQADQAQQNQNTEAFNNQVLLASQMGAQQPIEFVRAASTREWQEKVAEVSIQMWNAINNKSATPAPAPVATTQTQEILSRLDKTPEVPVTGAGGGGSEETDLANNFFKIIDKGESMFPI
jgi:hypothetical protein